MSESANFGADIGQVSTKNYEQIGETYREALNWKDRGYSIIFDVMMVIMIYYTGKNAIESKAFLSKSMYTIIS